MFDFAKIQILTDCKTLLNNPNIEFKRDVSLTTGEVLDYCTEGEFRGLNIKIYNTGYIELSGSFHKFFTEGYNHNDYTYSQFIDTLATWSQLLLLNPYQCLIHNLEFGVNISPPIRSKEITKSFVNYKGQEFSCMRNRGRSSLGVDLYTQRYGIKAYDKGAQYRLDNEVFRFEIKVMKMEYLKQYGIKTLADLLNPSKVFPIGQILKDAYEQIVLIDKSIDMKALSKSERAVIDFWGNPKSVVYLEQTDRNRFNIQRRYFWKVQNKYTVSNIQSTIAEMIFNKWNDLSRFDNKCYTKLTKFLRSFPEFDIHQFNSSNSRLIPTISDTIKVCIITGENISDQKEGSRFLSSKKIGEKEAHKLRNIDSNPRNNLRKKIEKIIGEVCLFPLSEMIVLKPSHYDLLEVWRGTKFEINIPKDR